MVAPAFLIIEVEIEKPYNNEIIIYGMCLFQYTVLCVCYRTSSVIILCALDGTSEKYDSDNRKSSHWHPRVVSATCRYDLLYQSVRKAVSTFLLYHGKDSKLFQLFI